MTEYLVLALIAPMGAFGDLAGHERRGSALWPGRSAVVGLLGAALGIRRDDRDGLARLDDWRMAVSVLEQGHGFEDFHTVQTVPSARIRHPDTRAAALAALKPSDNAVITRRDYRTDCAFGVALWSGADARGVCTALTRPRFTPYLGRKSCPLSAPMAPRIVTAPDVATALQAVVLPARLAGREPVLIASDATLPGARTETRWDVPIDRDAWHFARREVHISGNAS